MGFETELEPMLSHIFDRKKACLCLLTCIVGLGKVIGTELQALDPMSQTMDKLHKGMAVDPETIQRICQWVALPQQVEPLLIKVNLYDVNSQEADEAGQLMAQRFDHLLYDLLKEKYGATTEVVQDPMKVREITKLFEELGLPNDLPIEVRRVSLVRIIESLDLSFDLKERYKSLLKASGEEVYEAFLHWLENDCVVAVDSSCLDESNYLDDYETLIQTFKCVVRGYVKNDVGKKKLVVCMATTTAPLPAAERFDQLCMEYLPKQSINKYFEVSQPQQSVNGNASFVIPNSIDVLLQPEGFSREKFRIILNKSRINRVGFDDLHFDPESKTCRIDVSEKTNEELPLDILNHEVWHLADCGLVNQDTMNKSIHCLDLTTHIACNLMQTEVDVQIVKDLPEGLQKDHEFKVLKGLGIPINDGKQGEESNVVRLMDKNVKKVEQNKYLLSGIAQVDLLNFNIDEIRDLLGFLIVEDDLSQKRTAILDGWSDLVTIQSTPPRLSHASGCDKHGVPYLRTIPTKASDGTKYYEKLQKILRECRLD